MIVPARPREVTVPSLEKAYLNRIGWKASRGPKNIAHMDEMANYIGGMSAL